MMSSPNTLTKKLGYGVVSLLVLSYAFWIIYSNYQSQVELRALAVQRFATDFQHRIKTLERFISERQEDIKNLAADRSVMTFFENKALGMTMMYGLAISLNNVNNRFTALQKSKVINDRVIFPEILLLDENKNILVEITTAGLPESFNTADSDINVLAGQQLSIRHAAANPGYLVISSPCRYKEKTVGWVAAWIPYDIFFKEFLRTSTKQIDEDFILFTDADRSTVIAEDSSSKQHVIDIDGIRSLLNQGGQSFLDPAREQLFLLFADRPDNLPFEVVELIAQDEILGTHNPKTLFIGMATVFCLLFMGMIMLIQLSLKQQINAVKLDEAKERHRRIKQKNEELEVAQQEIERQNEDLKELDRLKDDFLANTSHELKTPLNGINGLALSILDGKYGPIPDSFAAPLEMVHDSGNRLLNMVEQILTFSRLAGDENGINNQTVTNIADVLAVSVAALQQVAAEKNINILLDCPNTIEVETDKILLESIVSNLLENALKFTNSGKILIKGELFEDENKIKGAKIILEDTGVGIDEDLQQHVFDRFYQGFSSENRSAEGSGIGLSIVKEGIESLGGKVFLLSEKDMGSQFILILPLDPAERVNLAPAEGFYLLENREPKTNLILAKQSAESQKKKIPTPQKRDEESPALILVVDDVKVNLEVVRIKLKDSYNLIFAESGQECLDQIRDHQPDLILLDIMMPGMSGYEVIEHLFKDKEKPFLTPIICLSAKTQTSSIIRAMQLGAVDYITKPFEEEELLVRIGTHLSIAKSRNQAMEATKQKSDFLADIFNLVPEGLITVDHEKRAIEWNLSFNNLVTYWAKRINEPETRVRDDILKQLQHELKEKEEGIFRLSLMGQSLSFEFSSSPVHSYTDIDLVVSLRDVTDITTMRRKLAQTQKLEAVGRLAAGIAHEINTPTQYVSTNVAFLAEAYEGISQLIAHYNEYMEMTKVGAVDAEFIAKTEELLEEADWGFLQEEMPLALSQCQEGLHRVTKIVSAMKRFSHPDSDAPKAHNLNEAIESTVTVSKNEWKYVAEMEMKFDESLPLVPCILDELNQVILNLIINSAHAIEESIKETPDKKGKICVTTALVGDYAEIHLSDTGAGMDEDVSRKVFEPFFTTKEVGKGTGQGLAIARDVIVDKHRGTIDVESNEGAGTTFIIRLPLAPAG